MGSPILFSGSTARLLKPILDFFGNAQILSGSVDPTSVATSAPKGSLYLNTSTGFLYRKSDAGSTTNWVTIDTSVRNFSSDTFSGNNSTTIFTLTTAPGSTVNTFVFINGVKQDPANYSVSSTTLTFTTAPPTGTSNISVIYGSALAVGTPAAGSVGSAQLQTNAVTKDKLAALGQQLSASSGTFSLPNSSTLTDVTNLSITITTTGRPVVLKLLSDGSGNVSFMQSTASTATARSSLQFFRGATSISDQLLQNAPTGTITTATIAVPPSSFQHTDIVGAGTYTYKVSVKGLAATDTTNVFYTKLLAYEL